MTKNKVKLPDLKACLQSAVNGRGKTYEKKKAIIVYYEDDDTKASDDAISLSNCFADVFGIGSTVKELEATDNSPADTITDLIHDTVKDTRPSLYSSSLIIFAYIGHAYIDHTSNLILSSTSGTQTVEFNTIKTELILYKETLKSVHTLGIMDCCYASGIQGKINRTCQVLAACGRNETARSQTAGITFVQRFAAAARRLQRTGAPLATIPTILQELQDTKPPLAPNAKLHHFGGSVIALPLKEIGQAKLPSSLLHLNPSSRKRQSILVQLTLDGEPRTVVEQFRGVLSSLPADFEIKLLDAYETDSSALVILRMNWESWGRLFNLDLRVIGIVIGPSLLNLQTPSHEKKQIEREQTSTMRYEEAPHQYHEDPTGSENVHPRHHGK